MTELSLLLLVSMEDRSTYSFLCLKDCCCWLFLLMTSKSPAVAQAHLLLSAC